MANSSSVRADGALNSPMTLLRGTRLNGIKPPTYELRDNERMI
jgi:hypothetical protein